jgi:hypothetical protein
MRAVPLPVHSAVEAIAAPAVMILPFVLGFGFAASVISVAIGAVLLGLALQADETGRAVPLSAHAGFDYAVAAVALAGGLAVGLGTGDWNAGIFLVGVGAAIITLTASTRFSAVRGT